MKLGRWNGIGTWNEAEDEEEEEFRPIGMGSVAHAMQVSPSTSPPTTVLAAPMDVFLTMPPPAATVHADTLPAYNL